MLTTVLLYFVCRLPGLRGSELVTLLQGASALTQPSHEWTQLIMAAVRGISLCACYSVVHTVHSEHVTVCMPPPSGVFCTADHGSGRIHVLCMHIRCRICQSIWMVTASRLGAKK